MTYAPLASHSFHSAATTKKPWPILPSFNGFVSSFSIQLFYHSILFFFPFNNNFPSKWIYRQIVEGGLRDNKEKFHLIFGGHITPKCEVLTAFNSFNFFINFAIKWSIFIFFPYFVSFILKFMSYINTLEEIHKIWNNNYYFLSILATMILYTY